MLSPGPSHAALSSAAPAFWASEADTPFGAEYGYLHAADRDGVAYLPDLLLVFVHGINSDPMGCWGDLPQRVARVALRRRSSCRTCRADCGAPGRYRAARSEHICQSARKIDPRSASKIDPPSGLHDG